MPLAQVGAVQLYYERTGAGDPLLWLPGFAISSEAFQPVLPLYASSFECITFDNRASGRSSFGRQPVSVPLLAGDAVHLLDALGIDAAHVYGVSYGGMVAQEMAIRFPDRVRGLILGGTTPGGPLAALPRLPRGRDGLAGLLFSPAFRRAHPEVVRETVRRMRTHRAGPAAVSAHFLASTYHDTYRRLGRIGAPTLVLHGEADTMAPPANSRALAAAIPDAELAVVPGAGHVYLIEHPEESARLVLDFLRRRAPQPGARRRDPTEPLTRALGIPVGMARTTRNLAALARQGGHRHVAAHR